MIKDECLKAGPKQVLGDVSAKVGGLLHTVYPGQLPRSEKQITNIKKDKSKGRCGSYCDELFMVMQKAHVDDQSSKFIQAIRTAPDPAIVLSNDCQTNDLIRFCTDPNKFCVLTVDPTFSLGEFDVTPVSYRHLLLETKRNKKHPTFLGPVLVHYRKTFGVYLFFASAIVGLCPKLQGVRAFGTDGEQSLASAFGHAFPFSQRLLCFIHVKRNIKEKCSEYLIPSELTQRILDDVFGKRVGDTFLEGLVDASDEDFLIKMETVITMWEESETSSSSNLSGFVNWFKSNKTHVIRDHMLKSTREECGLGCPPEQFTTNASESINAMLKRKMDYKRSELMVFIEKVSEIVDEQQKEVERAIIGRGKYQLCEQYQSLEIPESRWFLMNTQQRKAHLKKLHSVTTCADSAEKLTSLDNSSKEQSVFSNVENVIELSVDLNSASQEVSMPITILEGIWTKAHRLLTTNNAIVLAPGQPPEARMVLSYSGKTPHMVLPKKNKGDFSCDSNCPNYKALGICSHIVAVAEVNGQLPELLSAFKKRKGPPNVTRLVTTNMPKGRGRKGGVAPRSRKPQQLETTRIAMNISSSSVSSVAGHGTPINPNIVSVNQSPFIGNLSIQQPLSPSASPRGFPYSSPQGFPYSSPQGFPYSSPQGYPYSSPQGFPHSSPYQSMSPFVLCFISGNISVCYGCKNKYIKSTMQSPDDLCIQHQDWRREYVLPDSNTPKMKFGNVYYHCKLQCIWLRYPYFTANDLVIHDDIHQKLDSVHLNYLQGVFGLTMTH